MESKREAFEIKRTFRAFNDIIKEADYYALKGNYESFGHYVRVALIKLNREEREKLGKKYAEGNINAKD